MIRSLMCEMYEAAITGRYHSRWNVSAANDTLVLCSVAGGRDPDAVITIGDVSAEIELWRLVKFSLNTNRSGVEEECVLATKCKDKKITILHADVEHMCKLFNVLDDHDSNAIGLSFEFKQTLSNNVSSAPGEA